MTYTFISENDFQKARKKIREAKNLSKNKETQIVFSSTDDELNRKILEKETIDVLLINMSRRKDKMKQRDSGFNHVLAKLSKKKNVAIGINFDEILSSRAKEKTEIVARIRQNVELCNKNEVKMVFISKEHQDQYNLRSLGLVLGMPTWMTSSL